jgi:Holliday junction resolvasome RuvABC ATP-dependent DNA helicase subunit
VYGQERIKRELELLLPEIDGGRNVNIILAAPSGHGKTTLAYKLLSHFGFDRCQISMPPDFYFATDKRFHFMDEIQELKNPEPLYPYMDSNEHVIIIATNEMGVLKEPLINRCIPFMFEPYSEDDIRKMVKEILSGVQLSDDIIDSISGRCFGNPRIVRNLCMRLSYVFKKIVPLNVDELDAIMENIMAIYKDGLNPLELRYLDFLNEVGGRASLSLIAYGTHLDKASIMRDIEPKLLYLKKISITSKGRSLINNEPNNVQSAQEPVLA